MEENTTNSITYDAVTVDVRTATDTDEVTLILTVDDNACIEAALTKEQVEFLVDVFGDSLAMLSRNDRNCRYRRQIGFR